MFLMDLPRIVLACQPDDFRILKAAMYCAEQNKVLVLIVPCRKKLSETIGGAYLTLGDRLWLYEVSMGMQVVLDARAKDYLKNYKNSELYNE